MGRKWTYRREQVLAAVEGSWGIVSEVARRLGCGWNTADRHIKHWKETQQAMEGEDERCLDMSESELLKAIKAGKLEAVKFHLATKGKKRGYTRKREYSGPDDGPIKIVWEMAEPEEDAIMGDEDENENEDEGEEEL